MHANWSEEVRKFLEQAVSKYKRQKAFTSVKEMLKDLPSAKAGTADRYIRDFRDRS